MSNILNAVVPIFAGKGGTLRLAICGSILSGLVYSVMESDYSITWGKKDGISFSQNLHASSGLQEGSAKGIPCVDGTEGA